MIMAMVVLEWWDFMLRRLTVCFIANIDYICQLRKVGYAK